MLLRKSLAPVFILLAIFIFSMPVASYAGIYNEYAGQKGLDGQENRDTTNNDVGGRSTSLGYITPYQHLVANRALQVAFSATDRTHEASLGDQEIDPSQDAYLAGGIKYYRLTAWNIDGFSEASGLDGKYGIRRGAAYADSKENARTKGILMKHELYELIRLLDGAEGQGLEREALVAKLEDPNFAEEAKTLLQSFHDENPYKLEEGKDTSVPQHMPTPGVAGAAGNTAISIVEVGDASPAVLTKNKFFETNTNDANIITIPATVILDGTMTPDAIYSLATTEQKPNIAILLENVAQKNDVIDKFNAAGASEKLSELISTVKLAMVDVSFIRNLPGFRGAAGITIGKNPIILAAEELFKAQRGNLAGSNLLNLNRALEKQRGVQI